MLRVSMAAEKAGIPSVTVVATSFMAQARAFAKGLGVSNPPIAEYPGVPMIDTVEQLSDKTRTKILPQILDGLFNRTNQSGPRVDEPSFRDIVFKGNLEEVQDYFDEQLWSDGLPVIPPTVACVEKFLRFTPRSSDEVIGVCHPESRQATVWNIAVNGVMAGCRPEYMPILIAIVEAMMEPRFMFELAGTTPGWEPLVILNGTIIKQLGFNAGSGVMRVGRRANTSVGRFVRLFIRNVPGLRIPAVGEGMGGSDKASIGMTFNVVLAENEDAVAEIGWQPFSVDQGHASGENVVTVQSCMSMTQPAYTAGKDAIEHMKIICDVVGRPLQYRSWGYIRERFSYPMIVMSPSVAKAFAEDGWGKMDIKKYLYDHVLIPVGLAEKYARHTGVNRYSIRDYVERGITPREYCESDDPNRLVRSLVAPEMIGIVISGDPGRNQTRGYPQNSKIGVPISKKIQLPANWQTLLTP